jgi:hypothetical protein
MDGKEFYEQSIPSRKNMALVQIRRLDDRLFYEFQANEVILT